MSTTPEYRDALRRAVEQQRKRLDRSKAQKRVEVHLDIRAFDMLVQLAESTVKALDSIAEREASKDMSA